MERRGSRYLILGENPGTDKVSAGFSPEQIRRTWQYFRYDGADNLYNCVLWLGKEFGGTPYVPEEPKLLPWHGIWHPEWTEMERCQDAEGYLAAHYLPGRPTVGVMFYRTEWLMGDFSYQTALIRALEAQGLNAIAIFTNTFRSEDLDSPTLMDAVNRYFFRGKTRLVDVKKQDKAVGKGADDENGRRNKTVCGKPADAGWAGVGRRACPLEKRRRAVFRLCVFRAA